ncbi:MAG: hypothetical protein ACK41C_12020 [Phenylobacterium sp.]|uniref:hypothetical protein n=1 Tax=Phenylobacterium sp. TaxID=1871053 RepID=UPI00391B392A
MTDPQTPPKRPDPPGRRIPPLVWVIVAFLVVIVVLAVMAYGGKRTTPTGETVLQGEPSEAVMPPDPRPATR